MSQLSSDAVGQILIQATEQLQHALLELEPATATLEAQWLLAHSLKCSVTHLQAFPEQPLAADALTDFQQSLARRMQGEPLAYILGTQPFWAFELSVNASVLVPRSDTESLIDAVLSWGIKPEACMLDLGTGSGAIALALAWESRKQQKSWQITAVDNSGAALQVAQRNQTQLGLSVDIRQSDWYTALDGMMFDVIISNPPYIDAKDEHLSALRYEPITALVADNNGLSDIEQIIVGAMLHLNDNGRLIIEHGCHQHEAVQTLMRNHGLMQVYSGKDLANNWRYTVGEFIH